MTNPVIEPIPHLPLGDDAESSEVKPTWRGWIHAVMTPLVIASGIILIVLAHGAEAKLLCAVFFATSLLLFGNSALYHRFNWSPKVKRVFKRIDHANIFLLIAGTYTPLSFLALSLGEGLPLFIGVWAGALLGVAFRVFWVGAPRWLYVPLYILLGWAAISKIVPLFEANAAMMTLVLIGGLFYTIGAVAYGLKKPNPFPGKFGFHEIFHTCTVLAYMCHWIAILLIALHPVY
jgi:hemolysin III